LIWITAEERWKIAGAAKNLQNHTRDIGKCSCDLQFH